MGSLLLSLFCRRYGRGGWGPDPSAVTSRSAGHRIPGAPRCDRTSIREGGCYIRGESVSRSKLRCCVTAWKTTATTRASCAPTARTRATGSPRPHSVRSLPSQRQHKSLSLMKAKDKPAAARLSLSQPMEARPGGSSSQRSRLVVRESLFVVTLTVQCPCRISRAQVQCERP